MRAGRLLLKGVAQAEVARRVGVSRASVCEWNGRLAQGGLDALRRQSLTIRFFCRSVRSTTNRCKDRDREPQYIRLVHETSNKLCRTGTARHGFHDLLLVAGVSSKRYFGCVLSSTYLPKGKYVCFACRGAEKVQRSEHV